MSTLTHTPPTEGQIKQIARVASDAAEKAVKDYANFSKDGAQLVRGNSEFAVRIREATTLVLDELSVTDKHKNEEVASNYGYLSGYKPFDRKLPFEEVLEDLNRQAEILSKAFGIRPFFDVEWARKSWQNMPAGAEKLFLIPKWQTIAPTYAEAVQKVLDAIKQARNGKFYNYCDGKTFPELGKFSKYCGSDITNERLRQSTEMEAVFQKLSEEQKGHDILVVAAQFGLHHRGCPDRRAREVMQVNECGLGAFAAGIMLLTHPERLSHFDDLWIDCAGDEFDKPSADDRFAHAPSFCFAVGRVEFGTAWCGNADEHRGTASAFVSQS